jgi:uncharacterized protein DUF4038/collagenase-like protein with putative collagen-binding domain
MSRFAVATLIVGWLTGCGSDSPGSGDGGGAGGSGGSGGQAGAGGASGTGGTGGTMGGPVYPLKKSANGRYLVDQNNTPYLMLGDAPQALIANVSEADADQYFADRQAHGFNSVWVNLLCDTYTAGRADGSTYDGILPFTSGTDFSTPNEPYFARVDAMVRLAAAHGIQVILDPAETGGWTTAMMQNGETKCRDYGRFLGNRYKSFDNLIWMSGNDFQNWRDAPTDAVVLAVATGILDNDTRHLHTVELDYLNSSSTNDPSWAAIVGLNAAYSYYPTYAEILADYNRTPALPVFLVEANYEFESLQGPVTTPPIVRRQEYWTLLSGATGHLYGSHITWRFDSGWQTQIDSPGALQMPYLKSFFEARPWYDLVPDQNHSIIVSGYGTFANSGYVASNDYAVAARTPDHRLVIAYMPTLRTITIDLAQLAGPAIARWYDPSNGMYSSITGSPFANTGQRAFAPPGNNAEGAGDWVLVLESN